MTSFSLRREVPEDEPFLRSLFFAVRSPEFLPLGLPPSQLEMMMGMQFMAQRGSYRAAYPQAEWWIVERKGAPIGRMVISKGAAGVASSIDGWLLIDIALMPEHSGQGIGGALLDGVIADAKAAGKAVRLTVRQANPARRLYRAKGFVESGFEGPDVVMVRPA